jgi:hypothetical protein
VTAPGPLARKLAEVEAERDAALAEVERLRGVANGFVDEIAEITAELDQLRADATRWARALTRQAEMTSHQHDDTCVAEACAAALWLREMGQG